MNDISPVCSPFNWIKTLKQDLKKTLNRIKTLKQNKKPFNRINSPYLLPVPTRAAPPPAPERPPPNTSGHRTAPFASSAGRSSSAGSASLLLRERPSCPPAAPRPALCGPWRSESRARSGGSSGGGAEEPDGGRNGRHGCARCADTEEDVTPVSGWCN